ncbi:MAG TPA: dihydrofolate reductase [Bacillota bacterium]
MISLLVAMSKNHVIGRNNDMPWYLPNDLKYFKEKTMGHTIIMGRKTFESIGRPLPGRKNVVITRSKTTTFPDEVEVIHDLKTVQTWNEKQPKEEFFIIGGGRIYKQMLPWADRLYITKIDESFEGDTYFPHFSEDEWTLTSSCKGIKDEKNRYDYYYLQYDRK